MHSCGEPCPESFQRSHEAPRRTSRIASFLAPGWNRKASKSCTPENLEQSYAVFDSSLPHAVLLDVQLGREDGLFFARWMRPRQSLRDIPILAVAAHAMCLPDSRRLESLSLERLPCVIATQILN